MIRDLGMVNWESSGGSAAELDEMVSHHGHNGRESGRKKTRSNFRLTKATKSGHWRSDTCNICHIVLLRRLAWPDVHNGLRPSSACVEGNVVRW